MLAGSFYISAEITVEKTTHRQAAHTHFFRGIKFKNRTQSSWARSTTTTTTTTTTENGSLFPFFAFPHLFFFQRQLRGVSIDRSLSQALIDCVNGIGGGGGKDCYGTTRCHPAFLPSWRRTTKFCFLWHYCRKVTATATAV